MVRGENSPRCTIFRVDSDQSDFAARIAALAEQPQAILTRRNT